MGLLKDIIHLKPCNEARAWLKTQKSWKEAWDSCENGLWMVWLLERITDDHKKLRILTCKIARKAIDPSFVEEHDLIQLVEDHINGNPSFTYDQLFQTCRNLPIRDSDTEYCICITLINSIQSIIFCSAVSEHANRKLRSKTQADIVREFFPNPPILRRQSV